MYFVDFLKIYFNFNPLKINLKTVNNFFDKLISLKSNHLYITDIFVISRNTAYLEI